MALAVQDTQIDAVKGETNIWDLDATIALDDAQDSIWFTAKNKKSDVDADAVLALTKGAGITITDAANGLFRVVSAPADLAGVTARALVYDVKVKSGGTGVIQTVASGTMLLVESVNKDAA